MFRSSRIKFIRQKDAMQCGVACIAMICNYFGQDYSLEFLQTLCAPTNEGVSLKGISDTASDLGLKATSARVSINELSTLPLPCILHWNHKHFVVLYKIDKSGTRFWIADPAKGKYKCTLNEFQDKWISSILNGTHKGIATFFDKTEDFGKIVESKKRKHSFKFMKIYIAKYHQLFLQIALGMLLGCILQLIMPFLTQGIVDYGIKYQNIKLIWLILLGELMIVIGRSITDFIRRWIVLHISMRINVSLISDFFIKLLKLPMHYFDTKLIGDLTQRMGDHNRIQNFLTTQIVAATFSILSFLIYGVVLLIYNKCIFIIFLVGSLIYSLWIARFLPRRKVLDYELFGQQSQIQNKTYQFFTAIQEIKLQGCEKRRRWEWEDSQADLFNIQMKSMKLQQSQEAGSVFINEIKNILITIFSVTAVVNGSISLGAMLAIQYIVGQLNSPIEQLMQFVFSLQDVKISLERINEIHDSKNEDLPDSLSPEKLSKKSITLNNVCFRYNRHSLTNTVSNISITIPEGKITAIVGASGSGKTTLIKLMLGYYPVTDGEILIDDRNISFYNLKEWRSHCGIVSQDSYIFSESIARNIAINDEDINMERIEKAANIACISEFINSLPLKYYTKIGADGIGLSQGQKQRILIARAVYKNPDFIFFDEATNSLDAKNERSIVQNLFDFYKGKTVVIVAHRLSTVKNADKIVVLSQGQIVEIGTHRELIDGKGTYFSLVKNQLELGQ